MRVVNYLRAHGFANVGMADNRLLVTADGRRPRSGPPSRPNCTASTYVAAGPTRTSRRERADTLADTVLAVTGLQTVHMAHTLSRRVDPEADSQNAVPQAVVGISPTLFPSIYGASGMPSASSATIGIITQGSMTQTVTDLKSFTSSAGLPGADGLGRHRRQCRHRHLGRRRMEHGHPELARGGRRHDPLDAALHRQDALRCQPHERLQQGHQRQPRQWSSTSRSASARPAPRARAPRPAKTRSSRPRWRRVRPSRSLRATPGRMNAAAAPASRAIRPSRPT